MNINDQFPSNYLKASDVQGDTHVTMQNVILERIGDDMKPVLYLQGWDKGIVLNKTNSTNIASLYGAETEGWAGKSMTMSVTMVDFQGRSTPAIRLYPPKMQTHQAPLDGPPEAPPVTSANDYGAASQGR